MAEVTQTIAMRYVDKTKLIQYCVKLWGTVDIQVSLAGSPFRRTPIDAHGRKKTPYTT